MRRMNRAALAAAGLALSVAAATGCGGSSDKVATSTTVPGGATTTTMAVTPSSAGTATTTTAGPSTTIVPASTTTSTSTTIGIGGTVSVPEGANTLPAGDTVALLKSVGPPVTIDGERDQTVVVDVVQFLTGQAAVDAAVAHHDAQTCDGKPCVDDDYYVVNDNPKLRTVAVDPDADITIDGCDGGCATQVTATLAKAVAAHGYFRISVEGTGSQQRVSAIHQVFTP